MPDYEYKAIGRNGIELTGTEQADSVESLTLKLRKQQITLLQAKPRKMRAIRLSVTLPFISELSPLINSGIPLERALQIISEDSRSEHVVKLAEGLRTKIKNGAALSDALQQSGRFDTLLIALVKVGEASGELPRALGILEQHYQQSRATRQNMIASLTYPGILAIISVLSIIGLALFVVPVFKDIFSEETGVVLPLGTRIMFAFSDFLVAYGWVVAVLLVLSVIGVSMLIRHNDKANRAWYALQLKAPLLGELWGQFTAFKLAKSLSLMLEGGLPLVQAVEISRPMLTNRLQREGIESCLLALRKGEPIPQAMGRIPSLPIQFHRYIKLGNETGNLGGNLTRAADILQNDFRNRLGSFIAILDPLIIISMGGIVGFMVISILLAVFSLSDVH